MRRICTLLTTLVCVGSLYADYNIGESALKRGDCGLFLRIDALGWQAYQPNTQFALQTDAAATTANGRYIQNDLDFQGGFRLGGSYATPCSGWEIESWWTRYAQKNTKNYDSDDMFSLLDPATTRSQAGSSQFSLSFNTIDLGLKKSYWAARCLSWSPHFGVKALIMREKQKARYSGGAVAANSTNTATIKSNFNGVGMVAGSGLSWDFMRWCGDWSILSDGSIGLITGKTLYSSESNLGGGSTLDQTSSNFKQVRSIFDLTLGIRWEKVFCKCYPLSFDLVWENVWLPDTWNSAARNRDDYMTTGDLSFSGVTLSCRLGF